jgi:hypothetical protein
VCDGGIYRVKKIARVHEHVRLFFDNNIDRGQEVIVDLLLAPGSSPTPAGAGECGEAEMRVCDVDELHSCLICRWGAPAY